MLEEMGSLGSKENCYALYQTCVEEPHKFMYVDEKYQVFKTFTEHVWSKFTEEGRYNTDFVGADGNSIEDEKNAENKISANNNKDGISK